MADVRVAINLPYLLRLPAEDYATPAAGGSIRLREIGNPSATGGPGELRSEVSAVFTPPMPPSDSG